MSLLSRYYAKEAMQRRLLENIANESEGMDDEVASLYKEIAYIKDNIVKAVDNTNEAVHGFFGSAGYSF